MNLAVPPAASTSRRPVPNPGQFDGRARHGSAKQYVNDERGEGGQIANHQSHPRGPTQTRRQKPPAYERRDGQQDHELGYLNLPRRHWRINHWGALIIGALRSSVGGNQSRPHGRIIQESWLTSISTSSARPRPAGLA